LLLAAVAIASIGRNVLFVAALVGVASMSLRANLVCHPGCSTSTQDFRSLTTYVTERAGRRDSFVFDPAYIEIPFNYYARKSGTEAPCETRCSGPEGRRSIDGSSPQVWLVIDEGDPKAGGDQAAPAGYRRTTEMPFSARLLVVRYVRAR